MWLGPLIALSAVLYACLGWWAFGDTIRHDMGGPVAARLDAMQRTDGVRIDGACYSACTLFLGLPHTCVTQRARLGFHSPSTRLGIPLPREEWERVTRLMAAHYPAPLAQWWMAGARWKADPVILTGAQAIKLGARGC